MQVAEAVAAFAATHPAMSVLACSRKVLRAVTAENRTAEDLADVALLPQLVQCGDIAAAELPPSASFGPIPFVLGACIGSSSATPSSVQTIGGDNWVIWPWYATSDWMSATLADELTTYLGLSLAQEPYTLTLESAASSGERSGASCHALRGFMPPRSR
jgi:hypothetical protein